MERIRCSSNIDGFVCIHWHGREHALGNVQSVVRSSPPAAQGTENASCTVDLLVCPGIQTRAEKASLGGT